MALAASTELRERDALKSVGLAAMTAVLIERGVAAALAGEFGVLAFTRGYAAWVENDRFDFATHTLEALREASASLRSHGRHMW